MALHFEAWLKALESPGHEILSNCPLKFGGFRALGLAKIRFVCVN